MQQRGSGVRVACRCVRAALGAGGGVAAALRRCGSDVQGKVWGGGRGGAWGQSATACSDVKAA